MDAEDFKKVFLPCHKKLYRIAYRFLENQEDAEDMVQETYIKLWQKRSELESLINPESYAVTLLKNSCLDFLKKVKPEISAIYELDIPAIDSLDVQVENKDKLNIIHKILDRLPEQQRQLFQWKIQDNHSDEEIEKLSGLSRGNIKVIISRTRKTIKERYLKLENR
jgi:RNA polymerase sigma-70 factor (ECF subfamily)